MYTLNAYCHGVMTTFGPSGSLSEPAVLLYQGRRLEQFWFIVR
jgi:hypothetical protein